MLPAAINFAPPGGCSVCDYLIFYNNTAIAENQQSGANEATGLKNVMSANDMVDRTTSPQKKLQ
jgi:hypothetical protein